METIQLALLEQAKKRNAIAKEQNAITKERNAIVREQVAATKQQTATFYTLDSKVDTHEAILTAMESKLATVILQPSLPGFVAAATKAPLKLEEPMELIGCTIADPDFVQLLNYSLKQFVIADFFGPPPIPSTSFPPSPASSSPRDLSRRSVGSTTSFKPWLTSTHHFHWHLWTFWRTVLTDITL